jgi:hypothetical protein
MDAARRRSSGHRLLDGAVQQWAERHQQHRQGDRLSGNPFQSLAPTERPAATSRPCSVTAFREWLGEKVSALAFFTFRHAADNRSRVST